MKNAIDIAYADIDRQFDTLQKRVKSLSHILDISPRTLNRLIGDKAVAHKLQVELINSIGHPYIGAESNFIAITSPSKLGKAKRIIAKYTEKVSTSDLLGTRQEARGKYVLKKSKQIGATYKKNVNDYIASIQKFTSPELISELRAKSTNKIDTVKISMKVPSGRHYKKLESQALRALASSSIIDSSEVDLILDSKIDMIAQTFKKGKAAVKEIKKKKRKKVRIDTVNTNYFYYGSLSTEEEYAQESSGHLDLFGTLSSLINDYLLRDNRPSVYPVMHSKAEKMDTKGKNYLRNISGTFAKSAVINYATLDTTDPSLVDIGYSYQTFPYDVFENAPHNAGRDPRNIIGGAIRDIMKLHFTEIRIRSLTKK